jgi:hypothetical protein
MAFLSEVIVEELRRFGRDESGFSFIDWAITISLVSMAVGFFIPDLWVLFDRVMQSVTNDVEDINTLMKMY